LGKWFLISHDGNPRTVTEFTLAFRSSALRCRQKCRMKPAPNKLDDASRNASEVSHSLLGAFRHRAFAIIWTATVVSNVGTWMYSSASGWLMASLNADPLHVSLVQVASTLPMFLLALPAGALADIVDKRRFLICGEIAITLFSIAFALLVWRGLVTPGTLLLFAFLIGAASALVAPAWQAVVPQLVPRKDLSPAVTANSVGINISRAVGPAVGGIITAGGGIATPFWANALSNFGVIAALWWWRAPASRNQQLPAERLLTAIRSGVRHTRNNSHLRATLLRAVAFFVFASAYWALLPLVAHDQIASGPALYGFLLGCIGTGAIAGAFAGPRLAARFGPDRLVALGTLGTALALFLFGSAHQPIVGLVASLIAGISWTPVVSSLNVSAQVALPDWVRGRGLAVYVTTFSGAMTLGSALWGQVAHWGGLPLALYIAAAGVLLGLAATWGWKLHTGAKVDLSPSMHWPAPVVSDQVEPHDGPVLVTVEYRIDPKDRTAFLTALDQVSRARRGDGAYAWGIFEDTATPGRLLETFLVESWIEHLRQHERVTQADRLLEEHVRGFVIEPPKVTHLIAAEPETAHDER
jgi:MFS family permease